MSSGIYKIANKITGDFYIGSAVNLKHFNSPITKNIEYVSDVQVGTISMTSYIVTSIKRNSMVQKIKYILSKVF